MKKKAKKEFGEATLASVKKEMAKPRLAMSAREGERDIAAGRKLSSGRRNREACRDGCEGSVMRKSSLIARSRKSNNS